VTTANDKAARIAALANTLREALAQLDREPDVLAKPMFGGAGFYVGGRMIAAWYGDLAFALKLPPAAQAELLALPGAQPAQSATYTLVPPDCLDDPARLSPWLARSLAWVETLPVKKRKSKK
jgi:TfoX/Sxy family transcriptional regulator of competence genes